MAATTVSTMEKRINETAVPDEYPDQRIDTYLSRRFTYLSRSAWKREIGRGRIFLNGLPVSRPDKKIRGGDVIRYEGQEIAEPVVDDAITVLFEDDVLVAVNKPGNLPVHPSGRYFNNTLQRILEHRRGYPLFPIHRLDRETSGVLLIAKRSDVAAAVQRRFNNVRKKYIALVHGDPGGRVMVIDTPLGFDETGTIKKRRIAATDAPEKAVTTVKRIFSFGNYSLIKILPRTGRLHQIRVHLHHAGYPIVGDKLYGKDENLYLRFIKEGYSEELAMLLELPRSALHARSLLFPHPVEKKMVKVKAPVPADFREFIRNKGDIHG